MAAQEIKVPDIGDFDSVEVIEVLVSEGDTIEQEQPLITLESDKATLEVPSAYAGKITELKVEEGGKVSEGDVIALVDVADAEEEATEPAEKDDNERAAGSRNDSDRKSAEQEQTVEVKVPDIGDFDSVEVIEVLVSEGDTVEQEQPLITLESDKATLEVPSTVAGTVAELKVAEGGTVSEGDVIALLLATSEGGEAESSQVAPSSASDDSESLEDDSEAEPGTGDDEVHPPHGVASMADKPYQGSASSADPSRLASVDEGRFGKAHASPSVRKYARELGADLGRIQGTGRKKRITFEDVQTYVKGALSQVQSGQGSPAATGGGGLPAQPDIDFSKFGEVEIVELERIRKISSRAVHRNWLLIPHVTQFDTADITDMEAFRQANKEKAKAEGVKLTPLAFLLKASAAALKAFPDLNSSLTADGDRLVHKKYCNIAVAVDTPNGLLMPVIKDVDKKGIYQLARDLEDVSSRAREGKIKGDDMQGACFSISSLGGVGGTAFTPIVNSPEVGILGVSRHAWQPVWNGSEFEPRLILPLSLSYDHRVIDGAKAARITGFLSRALGDLRTLLL